MSLLDDSFVFVGLLGSCFLSIFDDWLSLDLGVDSDVKGLAKNGLDTLGKADLVIQGESRSESSSLEEKESSLLGLLVALVVGDSLQKLLDDGVTGVDLQSFLLIGVEVLKNCVYKQLQIIINFWGLETVGDRETENSQLSAT